MPKGWMTKVVVACASLGLVAAAFVLRDAMPVTPTNAPTEPSSAPPTAEEYYARAETILRPIKETWRADATSGMFTADIAALSSAKRALMALTVPADVREWHLAVILALSRVEQYPTNQELHGALFMTLQ